MYQKSAMNLVYNCKTNCVSEMKARFADNQHKKAFSSCRSSKYRPKSRRFAMQALARLFRNRQQRVRYHLGRAAQRRSSNDRHARFFRRRFAQLFNRFCDAFHSLRRFAVDDVALGGRFAAQI